MKNIGKQDLYLALAILLLTIGFVPSVYADTDLWWHLRAGSDLLLYGKYSEYSFIKPVKDWINHEWLWDLALAKIFLHWGFWGIALTRGLLLYFAALLFTYKLRQQNISATICLLLAACFLYVTDYFFNHQPGLISFLLLLACVLLSGNLRKHPIAIVLLIIFGICANMHAGFLAGMLVIFLALLEEVLAAKIKVSSAIFVAVCLLVTTLLNPDHFYLWGYIFKELSAAHTANGFWLPLNFSQQLVVLGVVGLILLFKLLLPLKTQINDIRELILLLVFAWAVSQHQRMLPFFVLFVLWQSAPYIDWLFVEIKSAAIRTCACITVVAVVCVSCSKNYSSPLILDQSRYPVNAVKFLSARSDLKRILCPFDWGGYLLWNLSDIQVGFDGRYLAAFSEQELEEHVKSVLEGDLASFVKSYPAQALLLGSNSKLASAAVRDAQWQIIYQDQMAIVFVKANS